MEQLNDVKNTDKAKQKLSKVFGFFNSPLGLWILSTLFIGFITFMYQNWSQSVKQDREKSEQIKNLETEINRRLFIFNQALAEVAKMDTLSVQEKDDNNYPRKVEEAIQKVNSKNCYVFEQFRKRKMSSLLYELFVLLPKENKAVARDAFEKMFLIEQFPKKIKKHTGSEKANDYFNQIVAYTKTSLSADKLDNK